MDRTDNSLNDEEDITILDRCKIDSFDDLLEPVEDININEPFDENLIRGIYAYGFEVPSHIQSVGIRAIATGRDVIGQAQSGTGKTGAFTIGSLNKIDTSINDVQLVILVHTYEMVLQIEAVIAEISKYTDIRTTICAKGITARENRNAITGYNNDGLRPHVLVGTPGRTLHMLNEKEKNGDFIINCSTIKMLVLDEADELLGTTERDNSKHGNRQNNFIDQIKNIIKCIPKESQICLFSATMNQRFFDLTTKFMNKPLKIVLKTEEITLEGIKQFKIELEQHHKVDVIFDLYNLLNISKCVIYCNNKKGVDKLYTALTNENYICSIIHSDLTPKERDEAMRNFRHKTGANVLISTDLIGRGIDIQQLSVVINYDIPFKSENYIHRIGRSGRHGRKGVAINLVTERDEKRVDYICKYYQTEINELPENVGDIIKSTI